MQKMQKRRRRHAATRYFLLTEFESGRKEGPDAGAHDRSASANAGEAQTFVNTFKSCIASMARTRVVNTGMIWDHTRWMKLGSWDTSP